MVVYCPAQVLESLPSAATGGRYEHHLHQIVPRVRLGNTVLRRGLLQRCCISSNLSLQMCSHT